MGRQSGRGAQSVSRAALALRLLRRHGLSAIFGCFSGLNAFCSCHLAPSLPDARLAADLASQVVETALADVAVAEHVDLVDARRVDHEGPLDTDPMGHAPDLKFLPHPPPRTPDPGPSDHRIASPGPPTTFAGPPTPAPATRPGTFLF